MTRDKVQKLYEKSKEQMEQARATMQKYAHELEEIDKTEFWETAQKYHIGAAELKELIKLRELENRRALQEPNRTIPREKTTSDPKEDEKNEE